MHGVSVTVTSTLYLTVQSTSSTSRPTSCHLCVCLLVVKGSQQRQFCHPTQMSSVNKLYHALIIQYLSHGQTFTYFHIMENLREIYSKRNVLSSIQETVIFFYVWKRVQPFRIFRAKTLIIYFTNGAYFQRKGYKEHP